MAKYHINPKTGNPGLCQAQAGGCPFGTEEDHFSSPQEARAAYEKFQTVFPTGYNETTHHIPLPAPAAELIGTLHDSSMEAYVVGGTVRDSLASDVHPKDVDLEVYGVTTMDELSDFLRSKGYKVDEVGKQYGVLKTLLADGTDVDISLPRKDSLTGHSHKDFEVEVDSSLSLEEAASRRDFTINALYYDHINEKIIDPVNGLKDWDSKILRPVSEAFAEDPLRVLRGVQFASRFDLKVSEEYAEAGRQLKDQYGTISTERVQEEFSKLFLRGQNIAAGLQALRETEWDTHFGFDQEWWSRNSAEKIAKDTNQLLALANQRNIPRDLLQASYLGKTLDQKKRADFFRVALIESRKQNLALRLVEAPEPGDMSPREIKKWARGLGKSGVNVSQWTALNRPFAPLEKIKNIEQVAKKTKSFEAPLPDLLSGKQIMDLTGEKKGGPWIGQLLRRGADAQDNEVFTTANGASKWLKSELKKEGRI